MTSGFGEHCEYESLAGKLRAHYMIDERSFRGTQISRGLKIATHCLAVHVAHWPEMVLLLAHSVERSL